LCDKSGASVATPLSPGAAPTLSGGYPEPLGLAPAAPPQEGRVAPWAGTPCGIRLSFSHGVPKPAEPRVRAFGAPTEALICDANHWDGTLIQTHEFLLRGPGALAVRGLPRSTWKVAVTNAKPEVVSSINAFVLVYPTNPFPALFQRLQGEVGRLAQFDDLPILALQPRRGRRDLRGDG